MEHPVLLINDMAGYGKVALAAMIPVMSHMGLNVCNLPTALVSNTLDYGKFEILDTTGYMQHTLKVWEELGFRFDAVSTGFIVSDVQAQLVTDYCLRQAGRGVLIFCDPIMGGRREAVQRYEHGDGEEYAKAGVLRGLRGAQLHGGRSSGWRALPGVAGGGGYPAADREAAGDRRQVRGGDQRETSGRGSGLLLRRGA